LLRWFEGPQSDPREEYVEVIDDEVCQTVIRSSRELSRETEVTLITKDCTAQGVVQACRTEGSSFLLTLAAKLPRREGAGTYDPGTLVVDDFLSEEQEAAILAEINDQALVNQALSDLLDDSIETPSLWHPVQPGSAHGQLLPH
jgi:hypothetical protein